MVSLCAMWVLRLGAGADCLFACADNYCVGYPCTDAIEAGEGENSELRSVNGMVKTCPLAGDMGRSEFGTSSSGAWAMSKRWEP